MTEHFVSPIVRPTIRMAVTPFAAVDAFPVVALLLILGAQPVLIIRTIILVRPVATVVVMVTLPPAGYTSAGPASEIRWFTLTVEYLGTAVWLVFLLRAVNFSIALPAGRDASAVVALEHVCSTGSIVRLAHRQFVTVVPTVIFLITYPHLGNACTIVTMKLRGMTLSNRTINLILAAWAVFCLITLSIHGNTERVTGPVAWTPRLIIKALIVFAVLLITVVTTVISAVANLGWMKAVFVVALKLSWLAGELATGWRLIRAIVTILLAVTLPPEGNALQGGLA